MKEKAGNSLIAFNSAILYVKMLITIAIALYSTRLVLEALGVEDYGIYAVVGGLIALLGFLKNSMSISTQRFMSFYLGTEDNEKLNTVFNTSFILHGILAIGIALILEVAGFFFFENILNISEDKIDIAKTVFHFMTFSTMITVFSVPFEALLNSHENFKIVALFEIVSSVLKLLIAFYLFYTGFDKLFIYSLLSALSVVLILGVQGLYTMQKYSIIKIQLDKYYDKILIKDMTSFAGWNTFGVACSIGRNQGVAVLLNIFYGTTINAAYGIANQINSQLLGFSSTLLNSFNPQILKSEGSQDRTRMLDLAMSASKFSFFMLAIIAVPVLIEMPFVLKLWLKEVPDYTVTFGRLVILITLLNQLGSGLPIILQAVGNIKWYQIIVGSLILLIIPIGYLFLYLGYPPYTILIVSFLIEIPALLLRLYFAKLHGGLSIITYLQKVVVRTIPILILTIGISLLVHSITNNEITRFVLTLVTSTSVLIFLVYQIGLSKSEKTKIVNQIIKIKKSGFN
ncbi:MATE family efflux transporter [uncultured Gelidibacter sp.]|uniref:MATE family efflux transporter n=1 Tax=uncultured Gelidibacter sp. TaxID=259318 RepID=UPI00263A25BB|nr:MATE family efflux transporter [uncultured Gelidibacter sp.]